MLAHNLAHFEALRRPAGAASGGLDHRRTSSHHRHQWKQGPSGSRPGGASAAVPGGSNSYSPQGAGCSSSSSSRAAAGSASAQPTVVSQVRLEEHG